MVKAAIRLQAVSYAFMEHDEEHWFDYLSDLFLENFSFSHNISLLFGIKQINWSKLSKNKFKRRYSAAPKKLGTFSSLFRQSTLDNHLRRFSIAFVLTVFLLHFITQL